MKGVRLATVNPTESETNEQRTRKLESAGKTRKAHIILARLGLTHRVRDDYHGMDKMKTRKTPDVTTDEFKERIKTICGIRPANPLLTRTPQDRGYAPPKRRSPYEVRGSAASNACFGAQ
jgi:hypothetical protein